MDPQAQIWRDKLNCTVSKIDAIFEEALARAEEVMNDDALHDWLAGTDVVCALGRGIELPLYYLDEMPEVVKHSDAAILPEVADLCTLLSREAVRGSIGPFLGTLAQVARRLDNADLLRIWLRMIRKMVTEAKGGTAPLLARAPYLFAQLSLPGVQAWVDYGMRVYRDYQHRLPDYFSLQSADSKAMLVKQRSGTLFMDAERQPAAETRENGNQRAAEGQADERVDGVLGAAGEQDGVEAGYTEQAQSDHQHAGDGATAEGDLQGGVEAVIGRLGGADIGAYRHVHADVAGQPREHGADSEAGRRRPVDKKADQHQQHDARHADRGVLPVQVGFGAILYGSSDFLHSTAASRFGQYPFRGHDAIQDGSGRAGQCKDKFCGHDISSNNSCYGAIGNVWRVKLYAFLAADTCMYRRLYFSRTCCPV